jgi:hypothetical protein
MRCRPACLSYVTETFFTDKGSRRIHSEFVSLLGILVVTLFGTLVATLVDTLVDTMVGTLVATLAGPYVDTLVGTLAGSPHAD